MPKLTQFTVEEDRFKSFIFDTHTINGIALYVRRGFSGMGRGAPACIAIEGTVLYGFGSLRQLEQKIKEDNFTTQDQVQAFFVAYLKDFQPRSRWQLGIKDNYIKLGIPEVYSEKLKLVEAHNKKKQEEKELKDLEAKEQSRKELKQRMQRMKELKYDILNGNWLDSDDLVSLADHVGFKMKIRQRGTLLGGRVSEVKENSARMERSCRAKPWIVYRELKQFLEEGEKDATIT